MPQLKPVYLVHGDDHGAVAQRRAGLRALAEGLGEGTVAVEVLEGERATPALLAGALATMTLPATATLPGTGTPTGTPSRAQAGGEPAALERVILVEGVERWREADVDEELAAALENVPQGTTVALFAREEARAKIAPALTELVRRAGGQVVAQMTVKPWELPKWVRARGGELGLQLDSDAAKALIAQVGERQQRLLRELETLALELGGGEAPSDAPMHAERPARPEGPEEPGGPAHPEGHGHPEGPGHVAISEADIERRAAHSAEWRAYSLADALLGGREREATLGYLRLREQGERLQGLSYLIAQRLREGLAAALRLQSGAPAAQVRKGLRMPPRAAERFMADVARTDPARLRSALQTLADLELDARGGPVLAAGRAGEAALDEDTLALRAIERICLCPSGCTSPSERS
jgi:DNA polymerase-3 subunit delta